MSINFAAKNVKMPGAIKAHIEKHLLDIEKIAGEIIDAEVIVNEEKLAFKVVISLKTRLHSFTAEERNKILKQAVRNALATLKTQAKRSKEKTKEEKKRAGAKGISMATVGQLPDERGQRAERGARVRPPLAGPADRQDNILISDNYSRKPITVEEAVFFLVESKESGYMFVNSETNRMAGVFRTPQGGISLIEPNL
jgi:putative sigma-54 modulation protein